MRPRQPRFRGWCRAPSRALPRPSRRSIWTLVTSSLPGCISHVKEALWEGERWHDENDTRAADTRCLWSLQHFVSGVTSALNLFYWLGGRCPFEDVLRRRPPKTAVFGAHVRRPAGPDPPQTPAGRGRVGDAACALTGLAHGSLRPSAVTRLFCVRP